MIVKTLRRLSAALLLSLTLSACGDGDVGQCEAYPACNADQTEVESCDEGDATCHENTLCGSTIYCLDTPTSCAAVPQCEPGDQEVQTCSTDGDCYEATECDATILCERVEVCDEERPPCIGGDFEVRTCPEDATCYQSVLCDRTFLCQEAEVCDAFPECEPDDIQVETCPDDASCYEREACGTTITCQATLETCDAFPVCDEGDTQVDTCPDDASCYEREACGTTITCEEAPGGSCAQSVECPDTHQNTPPCTEWGDCMSFYGCGEFQLLCSGEQRTSGCRATPTCPEGFEITEAACTSIDDPCVMVTVCDTTITCAPALTGG